MSSVPESYARPAERLRGWVEKWFSQAAACAWLAVAFTTVFDVLGRSLFGAPIYGAFELVKLFMAIGIFLSIPGVVLRNRQVEVELLSQMMPARARRLWSSVGSVIGAIVFAVIAYGLADLTADYLQSGERTTLLRLPLFAVSGFMAVSSVLISLGCLLAVILKPTDEET